MLLKVEGSVEEIIALADVLRRGKAATERLARKNKNKLTREEASLVHEGLYIDAIKAVRLRLGLGLKEAKDFVDASPGRAAALARPVIQY